MRKIDLSELVPDIVRTMQSKKEHNGRPVFLTISPNLPSFSWFDDSLEKLISILIDHAVGSGCPEMPARIAVVSKKRLQDLEAPLDMHPSRWVQLSIDLPSSSEPVTGVGADMKELGYSGEEEWVAEDSHCLLIAYRQPNQPQPQIVFCSRARRAGYKNTFLIPLQEPA